VNILTVNLLANIFVFSLVARIYLFPRLPGLDPRSVLVPILLLHATRHLGLMFLAPGAVYAGIPSEFTYPSAYGDLLASILAVIALLAVRSGSPISKMLVWVFNLEGSVDLIIAIVLATMYDAPPYMGAAYWIPAYWVPMLLVTHYITFVLLWKPWPPQPPATTL
jgi:hypothetical protein